MPSDRKRALLIGSSKFTDTRLARLFAPAQDVEALHAVLLDPATGGFNEVEVLVDEPLNRARRAIAKLCDGVGPNDFILLYYTGHGILSKHQEFYLATDETTIDLPEADGLEGAWVKGRLDHCRAMRQVLILDCCHSGAFIPGLKKAGTTRAVTAATFGKGGGSTGQFGLGRYVLTASDAQEFAWDAWALKDGPKGTDGKTSLFTGLIVEGLTSGRAAQDKEFVNVDDLYNFVRRNIPTDAPPMSPQCFGAREGEFAIARNPNYLRHIQEHAENQTREEEEKQRLKRELEELRARQLEQPDYAEAKRHAEEAERLRRELRDAREHEEKRKKKQAYLDKAREDINRMIKEMIYLESSDEWLVRQAGTYFIVRLERALQAEEKEDYRKAVEHYKEMEDNRHKLSYYNVPSKFFTLLIERECAAKRATKGL